MRRLVYINALGKSVTFTDYGKYVALSITGLGDIPFENETQKAPGQDGSTLIDTIFGTRLVQVEGVTDASGDDAIYKARAALTSVLNPKLGYGTLYFYGGKTVVRMLKNVIPSLPAFPQRDSHAQEFLLRFEAFDPFWYETSYTVTEMGGWEGGLEFPMVGGVETGIAWPIVGGIEQGIEFEHRAATADMNLINIGDEPTPVEVWFTGALGQARITNVTTGEFILVNRPLEDHEQLYICTEKGNKKVLLTNLDTGEVTNAFGYIDRASTFWMLQLGANQVTYDPAGASANTKVTVRYKNRFVGV